jgi:glycosyltransferase involved in cell wall biosynthesis
MSAHDPRGVGITRPSTWFRGPAVHHGTWEEHPYVEPGAIGTEVEVLRLQPRRALTDMLDAFDLVQVVAGVPAWANVAARVRRPVLLQAATLTRWERETLLRTARGGHALWLRAMTPAVTRLDRSALRHVRAAFVENERMRKALSRWMPAANVHFAPPGVDTGHFRPATTSSASHILAVGRWDDPRKNAPLLFQAYAALRTMLPAAPPLVVAGITSPTAYDLAFAQSIGIGEHIEIRTGLDADALADLYRGAALVVMSSDEEGLGLVLLEAMASGVPVVSTACGGPETSVVEGETGHLVPVGDAGALAQRMAEVLADEPRRRTMGEAARRHVEERFSLEAAGRPFLRVYDALVAGAATT